MDGPEKWSIKSTGSSSRRPYGSSQMSVTPVPGPNSGLHRYYTHVMHRHTCTLNTEKNNPFLK